MSANKTQPLTLPWGNSLLYRNHYIDLLCKSMKWFLYYKDLRNERVKCKPLDQGSHISISVAIEESYSAFSKAFHSSRKLKKIMITRSRFHRTYTAQKMKFSIKDFFSKCDQIRSLLRIWSQLLEKFLMENFIFCAVMVHWNETTISWPGENVFIDPSKLSVKHSVTITIIDVL